jgi:hypothetical protein
MCLTSASRCFAAASALSEMWYSLRERGDKTTCARGGWMGWGPGRREREGEAGCAASEEGWRVTAWAGWWRGACTAGRGVPADGNRMGQQI